MYKKNFIYQKLVISAAAIRMLYRWALSGARRTGWAQLLNKPLYRAATFDIVQAISSSSSVWLPNLR